MVIKHNENVKVKKYSPDLFEPANQGAIKREQIMRPEQSFWQDAWSRLKKIKRHSLVY